MAEMISGLDIDYGGAGLVGSRLRDFKVGSSWVSTTFETGYGVLLSRDQKYLEEARRWSSRVIGLLVEDLPFPGYEAILVRPDGSCRLVVGS